MIDQCSLLNGWYNINIYNIINNKIYDLIYILNTMCTALQKSYLIDNANIK